MTTIKLQYFFLNVLFSFGVQVFKEEEEAIKVDLHEGCSRAKLFWVMCLADSKTHNAVVEFREAGKSKCSDAN